MKKKDKAISPSSQRKKEIIKLLKGIKKGDHFCFILFPADKTKDNNAIFHADCKREVTNMCATLAAHLSVED